MENISGESWELYGRSKELFFSICFACESKIKNKSTQSAMLKVVRCKSQGNKIVVKVLMVICKKTSVGQ